MIRFSARSFRQQFTGTLQPEARVIMCLGFWINVWVYALVLSEELIKAAGVCWRVRRRYWLANLADEPDPVAVPA